MRTWPPLRERFFARINKRGPKMPGMTTRCHVWTGGRNGEEYGYIDAFGKRGVPAHQVAWLLEGNKIPKGHCVLHRCDNRPCVRISHLFTGTRGDNNRDRHNKGRDGAAYGAKNGMHTHPGMFKGSKHPSAKLTEERVRKLRQEYVTHTLQELASKYEISLSSVSKIVRRVSWRHI